MESSGEAKGKEPMKKNWIRFAVVLLVSVLASLPACSGSSRKQDREPEAGVKERPKPPPRGPARMVLVEKPVRLQDEEEPFKTSAVFDFDLPRPPRRARLVMRYTSVPGALSEDYKMGRFRHKVELNARFLMDLNTYSEGEEHVVEYTKWISVGMFKRHNKLAFLAGDDGSREGRPNHDEFELRSVVLEFDW
jgi:hypothetical protein